MLMTDILNFPWKRLFFKTMKMGIFRFVLKLGGDICSDPRGVRRSSHNPQCNLLDLALTSSFNNNILLYVARCLSALPQELRAHPFWAQEDVVFFDVSEMVLCGVCLKLNLYADELESPHPLQKKLNV